MKIKIKKLLDYLIIIHAYLIRKKAVKKNKKFYKNIKWSKAQQVEFDEFWLEAAGFKIPNYWHKFYEALSGVHDIRYMPEGIYFRNFEWKINNSKDSYSLGDKGKLNKILEGYNVGETYLLPHEIGKNSNGYYYIGDTIVSLNDFYNNLYDVGEIIIKPTNSDSGKGFQILDIEKGIDKNTKMNIQTILSSYKINYVIQKKLEQSVTMSNLNKSSINTFRVITYVLDGNIYSSPLSIRIGGLNSLIDNIHAGGSAIHVSDAGYLAKYAYKLKHCDSDEKLEILPNGLVLENYFIKEVPTILTVTKQLHKHIIGIGMISWDVALNKDGKIVILEMNLMGQSVWFPQILSGIPLFGENTKEMLQFLSKM